MARPAGARRRQTTIVRVPIHGKAEWHAATRERSASSTSGDRRPTRRPLEVLRAYIAAGSIAAAAYELGISESTARQHLSGLYRRTGCLNAAQAATSLGRLEGMRTAPVLRAGAAHG